MSTPSLVPLRAPRSVFASLRPALSLLGQYGFILGVTAAGIVAFAALTRGLAVPASLLLTAFALVLPSYGIDRLMDAGSADLHAYPERAARYRRQRRPLAVAYVALFGVALVGAATAGLWAVAAVLAYPLSVVLYVVPFAPRGFRVRRMKDIPYGKGIYSSLCWAGLVPLAARWVGAPLGASVALTTLYVFAQTWITCVVCDFKDEAGDRAAAVKTLPARFGRARTLTILRAVSLAALALALVAVQLGAWDARTLAVTIPSALAAHAYLRDLESRHADLRFHADVICDGVIALWLLAALVLAR